MLHVVPAAQDASPPYEHRGRHQPMLGEVSVTQTYPGRQPVPMTQPCLQVLVMTPKTSSVTHVAPMGHGWFVSHVAVQ